MTLTFNPTQIGCSLSLYSNQDKIHTLDKEAATRVDDRRLGVHVARMLRKIWNAFLITLGALVVAIAAFLWFAGAFEPLSGQDQASADNRFNSNARASCVTATRQRLNNPASAEWVDRARWPVSAGNSDRIFNVDMTFRATNALGGVITERRICRVRRDGTEALVVSVE